MEKAFADRLRKLSAAPRWSPTQAQWVIDELGRCALTIADFTAKYGLPESRLYYWRKRLAKPSAAPAPTASLVEVRLPTRSHSPAPSRIEIRDLREAFFAARSFNSLADLNRQLDTWLDRIAHRRPVRG